MDITNLGVGKDPFAFADDIGAALDDATDVKTKKKKKQKEEDDIATAGAVHIRVQQRNGRKCITTVQGLNPELDLKKILKALKKQECCNGTVVQDDDMGEVLQLQGDQRDAVATFLTGNGERVLPHSSLSARRLF